MFSLSTSCPSHVKKTYLNNNNVVRRHLLAQLAVLALFGHEYNEEMGVRQCVYNGLRIASHPSTENQSVQQDGGRLLIKI